MNIVDTQIISKSIRRRYILALSIIAILLALSQGIIQYTLKDQEADSRIINVAGRQRMLSQRITKCILLLEASTTDKERQAYLEELNYSRSLFVQSHIGLQRGDTELGLPGDNSAQVIAMFTRIEPNFQAIVHAVDIITAEGATTIHHQEALTSLLSNQAEFLSGMDDIVFQCDTEAKQKVILIKQKELVVLFVTCFVLLLEALFIFRPAEGQIQKNFKEYQRSEADLKSLFDMIPIPLIMLSSDELKFKRVNQAAINLLNISEEETEQKYLRDFLDMEQNEYVTWKNVVNRGNVTGIELPMQLRGEYARVMVFTTLTNYQGTPHLILGLVDITTKYNQSKYFAQLAATDCMTGLVNRRVFLENLEMVLLRVREGNSEVSLAFIDLDGLKNVNDTYGHREGDLYICTIASIIQSSIREYDILGRLGGDEFAVIFPQCSKHDAEKIIYRIQQQLDTLSLSFGKPYSMSFSVGVAHVGAGEDIDAENLLNNADETMYQQKQIRRR